MWPSAGKTISKEPILGGLPFKKRSKTLSGTVLEEKNDEGSTGYSLRRAALFAVFLMSVFSIIYVLNVSNAMDQLYPQISSNTLIPPPHPHYNTDTCSRLDSEFEFESPPDFTKLGIESWTDCRPIASMEGWKVEHCTAPGSIWPEHDARAVPESSSINNNSTAFLFRPRSPLPGQQYVYTPSVSPVSSPPDQAPVSLETKSTSAQVKTQPRHCNPSGYFRVQRLTMPTTDYTIGMDNANVELRCRNDPNYPVALNETTRNYVENFLGPDNIRAELDGAERYVTHQQINLGNCTYALPYVLSRPGRFWLTRIEHVYQDFQGMNENYPTTFVPRCQGLDRQE